MALGYLEYYDIKDKIRNRYGFGTDSEIESLKREIQSHRRIPKVGDLLLDAEYPEDAIAIVLEIGDRRSKSPYLLHCGRSGDTDWFDKEYVEYMTILAEEWKGPQSE
tara:strand:+ start:3739 stop:4059 length:321 start_codon:yes stop_codon:yes gene_type:complete